MENELSQMMLQEQMMLLDACALLLNIVSACALGLLALITLAAAGSACHTRYKARTHTRQITRPAVAARLNQAIARAHDAG